MDGAGETDGDPVRCQSAFRDGSATVPQAEQHGSVGRVDAGSGFAGRGQLVVVDGRRPGSRHESFSNRAGPAPARQPFPHRTRTDHESSAAPSSPAATQDPGSLKVGDVLRGTPDCPNTATDSTGALGEDGRITSAGGLSFPAIAGFTPTKLDYGFIHQANTVVKRYPESNNLMAAVAVGTLETSEGFAEVIPAAARVVSCLLGRSVFHQPGTMAEIVEINHDPRAAAVWLNTRIQISGIAGVNTNNISVFTHLADNGIMHVALVVEPDHDPEGDTAIWTAIEDLRLP